MTLTQSRRATGWPDLDVAPSGARHAIASRVARRLFRAAVNRLDITVDEPGATSYGRGGPVLRIVRPEEFYGRIGRDLLIGFGEGYLTGAWEADDLAGVLTVMARDLATLIPEPLQRFRRFVSHRVPSFHDPSKDNSQDNVAAHYDLSNELFRLFLDPSLTYSSALFPTDESGRPVPPLDLAAAQSRKLERLLDATGVGEGTQVLEIGTGWGELAIHAARRGARVHTITLSVEQLALAEQRFRDAGVSDSIRAELLDYRDLAGPAHDGQYDVVLSVEMIEAVGAAYWDEYFRILDRMLAPGGRVGIQAITMPHDRMLATIDSHTFITKYIFPGGFLPSVRAIEEIAGSQTRLRVTDRLDFGQHYAETLRQWDAAFLAARERVLDLGFDEIFIRMWHFYLAYSQAGFASGYIDVNQFVFEERP
jgi:cyclopropane-fatty-acyl-phospholipid synthase